MLRNIRQKIEKLLYLRGFSHADSRFMLSMQILTATVSMLVGLGLLWYSFWPLTFGIGATLAACGLWWLARGVQWGLAEGYSPKTAVIHAAAFIFRLGATAAALFFLLVICKLPVIPFIAGYSTVIVGLSIWGFSRLRGKSPIKEA